MINNSRSCPLLKCAPSQASAAWAEQVKWNDKVLKLISRPPQHNSNHTLIKISNKCDSRHKALGWVALEQILAVKSGIRLNKRNKLRSSMLSRYVFRPKRIHFHVKSDKLRYANRQLERKLLSLPNIMYLNLSQPKLYRQKVWTQKRPLKQIMKIWMVWSMMAKRMIITRAWATPAQESSPTR